MAPRTWTPGRSEVIKLLSSLASETHRPQKCGAGSILWIKLGVTLR